mgnify:CR=1 FL=1
MRIVWLLFGFVCVGLGIAGAVLPILPTTPFMLLAAFAFAKSSPRLHRWIIDHPTFGPPVRDWQASGAISRRAKIMAIGAMVTVLALSLILRLRWEVVAIQAVALLGSGAFILTRPSPPEG